MTEQEFIKLANKILYVKQSARTPFGGKKSELKGLKKLYKAINYTHCCTTLKDKEAPNLKDAFIAGYKKRALMSGLKYDEVSELNAISNFKFWMSFDLNL